MMFWRKRGRAGEKRKKGVGGLALTVGKKKKAIPGAQEISIEKGKKIRASNPAATP